MKQMMDAIVKPTAGPGLELRQVPVPVPGPGEVLIKIHKTAICGSDVHIYKWNQWAQQHVKPPQVIGHEYVGEVAELGAGVTGFAVGQRVSGEGHITCGHCRNCHTGNIQWCKHHIGVGVDRDGAFAEFVCIPARNVIAIDESLPEDVVSFFDAFGNATHTALMFPLIGEDVLITGAGPIGAFGKCTELRGNRKIGEAIGFIPVLGSMALAIGYTVVMGWIFKYTAIAITGDMHAMGQDMAAIGGHFDIVAISNLPWIIVAIVASFAIMAMGVSGGIEKANKVMMPVLFFLFVGLGIYIAFLPGASAGYKYIFTLDPKGLANPMVWIFAFGQAFFSLSVAGNGSVIYGSYLPKNENLPGSARNVAIFDTLAALLAAFVIIPAMAAGGAPLEKGGPGLMFVWLVNVLNGMPGGRIIGVIFFVCVLFAGLSSIINLYEAPVATLQDNLKLKRVPATAIILVIGCVIAILIQKITSEWMDVVSIYICPLGALLAGIMFFWVAGKKFVLDEVNDGLQKPIGGWFYPLAKYVYCILCIVALVAGAALGGIG